MKIQVTVELEVNNLPDADARALARDIVEARGLEVTGTRLVTPKGEGKTFIPKPGKPGSVLTRQGVAYVVWSEAKNGAWATKRDEQDGLYYELGKSWATPFHANGTHHKSNSCECATERVA